MQQQYSQQNRVFFYIVLVILAALGFWLVRGYLDVIVFSLTMVIILKPVYDFFQRRLKLGAGLATTATLIALVLAIIIPGWLMLRIVSNQVAAMTESFTPTGSEQPATLEDFQERANGLIATVPFLNQYQLGDEQIAEIRTYARAAAGRIGLAVANLGMAIPTLLAKLFVFLAIVGVLLPNYHGFVQRLLELSPLDDEVDYLFLRKIKSMVWAMFIGIVVIALAQGLIMGLFIWLGNVPYAPLWTLLAIIASSLPLGASLIAFPLAIYQLIVGQPVGALIILGGYILVVSNMDSLIRPRLVSKEAYLDAALVLVAALGGYDLFGFFGVVYGPVLMVLLITAIEVYSKYYAVRQTPPALSSVDGQAGPADSSPSPDQLLEPAPSLSKLE
ncbi:MAG TPA: AI-2E family transporter [Anaerolineae bacterium]|nr:AI-2E family transporter [Anaerolineae bacterium]